MKILCLLTGSVSLLLASAEAYFLVRYFSESSNPLRGEFLAGLFLVALVAVPIFIGTVAIVWFAREGASRQWRRFAFTCGSVGLLLFGVALFWDLFVRGA